MSGSVTVVDSSLLLLDWGMLDCLCEAEEKEKNKSRLEPKQMTRRHENEVWSDSEEVVGGAYSSSSKG